MNEIASKTDQGSLGPLYVVPDTNVFMHGKTLSQLPWEELGRPVINILYVPQVIKEIDKYKIKNGKLRNISRKISSGFKSLKDNDKTIIENKCSFVSVGVHLKLLNKTLNETLSLEHADQALINYCLFIMSERKDVLLLTNDTICSFTADSVGVPSMLLPEHWLRPPEEDEVSKENSLLKKEIEILKSQEPKIDVNLYINKELMVNNLNLSTHFWPVLDNESINDLMEKIKIYFPEETVFNRGEVGSKYSDILLMSEMFGARAAGRSFYPASEREIKEYREHNYPNWLREVEVFFRNLHEKLTEKNRYEDIDIFLKNLGTQPAKNVLVEIVSRGEISIVSSCDDNSEEIKLEIPSPPHPPQGEYRSILDLMNNQLDRGNFWSDPNLSSMLTGGFKRDTFPLRNSDEFYWKNDNTKWTSKMSLECVSWRHGQSEKKISLKIKPNHSVKVSGLLEIIIHADNIKSNYTKKIPVNIDIKEGNTMCEAYKLIERLESDMRFKM